MQRIRARNKRFPQQDGVRQSGSGQFAHLHGMYRCCGHNSGHLPTQESREAYFRYLLARLHQHILALLCSLLGAAVRLVIG